MANSVDPDQTTYSAVTNLGLRCLSRPIFRAITVPILSKNVTRIRLLCLCQVNGTLGLPTITGRFLEPMIGRRQFELSSIVR